MMQKSSDESDETAFGGRAYAKWKKREIGAYGSNRALVTVTEITNLAPAFRKTREQWEPWKIRPCDAGFDVGQKMIVEEGKKLVEGKMYCMSALASLIGPIWGMTYDCWFPWLNRDRGSQIMMEHGKFVKEGDGTFVEGRQTGACPDQENTVLFEVKKISA